MFEWVDRYNTGLDRIDDQHRSIVCSINDLMSEHKSDVAQEVVEKSLIAVDDYIAVHLSEEEELMRANGYPGLDDHLEKHAFFVEKFEEFKTKILHWPKHKVESAKLIVFLSEWFLNHIQVEDQKYVPYIKKGTLTSK